jgi:hypothetical protein
MAEIDAGQKKRPGRATLSTERKLLVGREQAAQMLSISCRSIDYLIDKGQLSTRRIGSRVLIPINDLVKFSQIDHPARLLG